MHALPADTLIESIQCFWVAPSHFYVRWCQEGDSLEVSIDTTESRLIGFIWRASMSERIWALNARAREYVSASQSRRHARVKLIPIRHLCGHSRRPRTLIEWKGAWIFATFASVKTDANGANEVSFYRRRRFSYTSHMLECWMIELRHGRWRYFISRGELAAERSISGR